MELLLAEDQHAVGEFGNLVAGRFRSPLGARSEVRGRVERTWASRRYLLGHGAIPPTRRNGEQPTADAPVPTTFVRDEEDTDALREARQDADLTASVNSVRGYVKQIGRVALVTAERVPRV